MEKIECAKCNGKIRLISVVNANWCKRDGLFYCRKCSSSKLTCPHCKQKVSPIMSTTLFTGIMFFIMFSLILIPFTVNAPNIIEQMAWNSLESMPISDIPLNDTVKINGNIESDYHTPIYRSIIDYPNGSYNKETEIFNFSVYDSSGEIPVNLSELRYYIKWAHKEYRDDFTELWFEEGDHVSFIGKARINESGNITFYPQLITLSSESYFFSSDLLIFGMFGSFSLIGFIIFAASYITLRRRTKRHQKNIETHVIKYPRKDYSLPSPAPDMNWIRNRIYFIIDLFVKICALITVVLFIPFVYNLMGGDIIDMLSLIMIISFPGTFAVIFLFLNWNAVPIRVGFDNIGIHAKYKADSPHSMFLKYIGWDDIKNVKYNSQMGANQFIFYTIDDRELTLANISKEIKSNLMKEYRDRKGIDLTFGNRI